MGQIPLFINCNYTVHKVTDCNSFHCCLDSADFLQHMLFLPYASSDLLLLQTFCEIDSEGNGILQKKDLRNVLYRFSLPITSSEFEKLWTR